MIRISMPGSVACTGMEVNIITGLAIGAQLCIIGDEWQKVGASGGLVVLTCLSLP